MQGVSRDPLHCSMAANSMRTGRSYFDQGNRLKVHRIFCCDLEVGCFLIFFIKKDKQNWKLLHTHLTDSHLPTHRSEDKWQSHPSFWGPSLVSRSSIDGLVGCLPKRSRKKCSQAASQCPLNQVVSVTRPKSHKKTTTFDVATSNVLLANFVKRAAGQCFGTPLFRCLSSQYSNCVGCLSNWISSLPLFNMTWHLKVNQASVCEAPLEITSFKKIAKFSHQTSSEWGYMIRGSWKNITPWNEWNLSAPQRCGSTWNRRFCDHNDLMYPVLFCCFCHLTKWSILIRS